MFGLSGGEILFIALIALILFGNEKLPENLKKMLHGLKRARKFTYDMQRSWHEIKTEVEESVNKLTPEIKPVLEKQVHTQLPHSDPVKAPPGEKNEVL